MIKVHWFRHTHEDRNNWLRFGLMELAAKQQIKYSEWDLKQMTSYGFSSDILNYPDLRHKSFLLVQSRNQNTKCLIDNEDSFVLFSELIVHVDQYFCAGYNSNVFERKILPKFYQWQTDEDVAWYKKLLLEKIAMYGSHFYKVKKFIPIAPNLWKELPITKTHQRWLNIQDRFRKLFSLSNHYQKVHQVYQSRYQDLIQLRTQQLTYDITLNDTSWGWPKHRIKLHQILKKLSAEGFLINSILKSSEPSVCDHSISLQLDENIFPMSIGNITNYEQMLASSKLGVFACGFHWGWRNILSLALFIGLPVVTDQLLTEAYFDMANFKIWETEDEEWPIVKELLTQITREQWETIKHHNQKIYDKLLHPEVVAQYFINESINPLN